MSTKKTDVLGNLVYASSSMSFASEIPGYNGSLFAISDGIKDRIESDLIEARAAVAELIEAASAVLSRVDHINPTNGPFWSGAQDQERLRAAIAAATGETK